MLIRTLLSTNLTNERVKNVHHVRVWVHDHFQCMCVSQRNAFAKGRATVDILPPSTNELPCLYFLPNSFEPKWTREFVRVLHEREWACCMQAKKKELACKSLRVPFYGTLWWPQAPRLNWFARTKLRPFTLLNQLRTHF